MVPSDKYLQLLRPLDGEDRLFQGHIQSPFGVQVTFPVICVDNPSKISSDSTMPYYYYLVILPCTTSDTREPHLLARFCFTASTSPELLYWVPIDPWGTHIIILKAEDIKRLQSKLCVKTFHLARSGRTKPSGPKTADPSRIFRAPKGPNMVLALSLTFRTILEAQGYDVEFYESSTRIHDDRAYDLLICKKNSRRSEVDGPSTSQPSRFLYESLKVTIVHRLRADVPLALWAVRGPHTLDLLRDLGPRELSSSSSSDISLRDTRSYDPQTTTTTRAVHRHVPVEGSCATALISFAPIELPPSTSGSVPGWVQTLHLTLEPDYSSDFYHVHAEISVDLEVQPSTVSRSASPIRLVTAGRQVHDRDGSKERLLKLERHLIPPWPDADGGEKEEEEGMEEPSVWRSVSKAGRNLTLFRLFTKR